MTNTRTFVKIIVVLALILGFLKMGLVIFSVLMSAINIIVSALPYMIAIGLGIAVLTVVVKFSRKHF